MMNALGVSKGDREEFRDKMSTIGNLREGMYQTNQDRICYKSQSISLYDDKYFEANKKN